jgi:hypothetical protein
MACLYGECITGLPGCNCAGAWVRHCDHCDGLLRTGMPDGRSFELVHENGTAYCRLLPGAEADKMTTATYRGKTSVHYA